MLTRRRLLGAGGLALAGLGAARPGVVEIRMQSDLLGAEVWFDPIGIRVPPGTRIRWVVASNVHTATAYHPRNADHALRIPEAAEPWDSGFLVNPGDQFEVTLAVEGVYDYFCSPHEAAGMIGRIVVGRPGGPGARPFDWFTGRPDAQRWRPVPEAARKAFPSIEAIMRQGIVRRA